LDFLRHWIVIPGLARDPVFRRKGGAKARLLVRLRRGPRRKAGVTSRRGAKVEQLAQWKGVGEAPAGS